MDVDAEHAAAMRVTMDSILSKLSSLDADTNKNKRCFPRHQKNRHFVADRLESCICEQIYKLGNSASPRARMGSFLPNTAQFVEECELPVPVPGLGHRGAVVVKACDVVTGETVALKTFHARNNSAEAVAEEEEEEDCVKPTAHRTLLEACFMAAFVGQPHIVQLAAVGRDPHTGQYCLVMEHVGPSLDVVLTDRQQRGLDISFPERDVRRMMRQVLSGVKAMHDRGVMHLNINPASIHVGCDGSLKIGDFRNAMSVSAGALLSHSDYAPVLSYLAPEGLAGNMLRGDAHDNENEEDTIEDSWSIGCLMLELLTGKDNFYVELDDDDDDEDGPQVQRIRDLLGSSDGPKPTAVLGVELAPEAQEYREQWRGWTQESRRLRELVPREVLSGDGFAVLQGLLTYNPEFRLKATDALKHPWFAADSSDDRSKPKRPFSYWWVLAGAAVVFFLMVSACLRGLLY